MSSRYDDELWELAHERKQLPPQRLEFTRSLEPAASALDLGCGDGLLARELDAGRLTVADVSPVALERARRNLEGRDVRFAELDPDAPMPFADSEFDLVHCAETLEHVRDVQLLLSEARRVLQPGGRLAITTPAHGRRDGLAILLGGFEPRFDPLSPHLRMFSARSLRGLLEQLGFDVRSLERRRGTLLALASR